VISVLSRKSGPRGDSDVTIAILVCVWLLALGAYNVWRGETSIGVLGLFAGTAFWLLVIRLRYRRRGNARDPKNPTEGMADGP
jgi:hypothetical protein